MIGDPLGLPRVAVDAEREIADEALDHGGDEGADGPDDRFRRGHNGNTGVRSEDEH